MYHEVQTEKYACTPTTFGYLYKLLGGDLDPCYFNKDISDCQIDRGDTNAAEFACKGISDNIMEEELSVYFQAHSCKNSNEWQGKIDQGKSILISVEYPAERNKEGEVTDPIVGM